MAEADGKRPKRVGERVRAELMEMLLRGVVHDPAARGAHVTEVTVSDDLRHARVYLRLVGEEATPARQKELLAAMGRARGFLRRELGQKLGLRYTPELGFQWDDDVDRAMRVEALLGEIARERRGPGDGTGAAPTQCGSCAPGGAFS